MSRKSSPTSWSATPAPRSPRRLRHLWQVPAFLAGVLALVGVCLSRPVWHPDAVVEQERQLDTARRLLVQPDYSLEQMEKLLGRALRAEDTAPERAAEAHLLLGTAYLGKINIDLPALRSPAPLSGEAAAYLKQAREHLEQAERLGVSAADQAKLRYRLGKVGFLAGDDPQQVVQALTQSLDEAAADNLAEAYTLLTHAYLRLPQPNLKAALEANRKQMDLPAASEDLLAPARLLRGELLLRLQDPAGAREVLQFVKPPAPAALIAQARCLQAQSYQDQEEWGQALKLWQEVLPLRPDGSAEAGGALYQIGVCYRRLEQRDEAVKAWEKVLAAGPPEEAVAAALGLAELQLSSPNPQTALDAFRRAVRDVRSADDWRNPYWDLKAARELFERGCVVFHAMSHYEQSMELAEVYEKVGPPGGMYTLAAQAAEAAAKARLDQARQARPRDKARALEEEARGLYRKAGKKHEASAETLPAAEQAERLWQAASCYLYAQEYADAARLLQRLISQGPAADRAAQAWFLLGEAERALRHDDAAAAAYTESSSHRGPHAYRARYQLAVLLLAQGQVDRAAELLEQNLRDLSVDPDAEAQQKSLFELAGLLFRRKAYRPASQRLEEALRHFAEAPEATTARYQLGECYRHLAQQEFENLKRERKQAPELESHYERLYRERLNQAATTHEELLAILKARLAEGALTEEEEGLLWRATLAAAECRTDLGDYERPIATYEAMAARYQGRVEGLYALAGVARCYFMQNNRERSREVLTRMKQVLDKMDDSAFPATPGMMTRTQWQEWVADRLPAESTPKNETRTPK